jgi:hypothetical protein
VHPFSIAGRKQLHSLPKSDNPWTAHAYTEHFAENGMVWQREDGFPWGHEKDEEGQLEWR